MKPFFALMTKVNGSQYEMIAEYANKDNAIYEAKKLECSAIVVDEDNEIVVWDSEKDA